MTYYIYNKVKRKRGLKVALLLGWAQLCLLSAWANPTDSTRIPLSEEFTEEHPLVYEDAWDLWPYVFLNDNGDPVGYNIDLLKLLMRELDIPYIIKLKPTEEALKDLKEGHADLMCGMDAHFHNDYAKYSKSVIQIFTHSVLHRKTDHLKVKMMKDLEHNPVIVHKGSFSHHFMVSKGWGDKAIPYENMREAVQRASVEPDCEIVWNTLSLKWLIRNLQHENLELTPLKIPHGEYRFMSNNSLLLERLDSVYTKLSSEGALQAIQNKWFYPEYQETGVPLWIWQVVGALMLLTLVIMAYYAFYRWQEKKMTKNIRRNNKRLELVLDTSHVHIWLYNLHTKNITSFNKDNSYSEEVQTPVGFFSNIVPADRKLILQAIQQIAEGKKQEEKLDVQSIAENDSTVRYYHVALSVLRRNKEGLPTDIIGTTSDITGDRQRQFQVKDSMLRYQTIFTSSMVDTIVYDSEGYMIDMNEKAASVFPGGLEGARSNRVHLRDVIGDPDFDVENMSPIHMTRIYQIDSDARVFNPKVHKHLMFYELQLLPLRSADGKLQLIFGSGRDVSEVVRSYSKLREEGDKLQHATDEMKKYIDNIDFVLQNGGVRMVSYMPSTHTLTIFSRIGQEQHQLTQSRALMLIADESKLTALRTLNNMDNLTRGTLKAVVKTNLRDKSRRRLQLYLSFIPTLNQLGQVTGYFGMCRDISEIKSTEELLAKETGRAQEVEAVKDAFLHNMSYEIRTPLNSVVGFAELFAMEHAAEDEGLFISEIKQNSERLLKLINDILFLSRLDAHMIEMKQHPVDFAEFFEPRCQAIWYNCKRENVDFVLENPYQRLVVDIDEQNLGIVFEQIIANAAEHTTQGQIRVYYDYTGEELAVTFQDTGCGISEERMQHLFERFGSMTGKGTGLGLPICYEIVKQMGGRIRVKSELGKGTIVWVTIPCKCTEIVRK